MNGPYDEDEEIPYEFSDPDAFYSDWYGADNDEELYDAIESDDPDDQEIKGKGWGLKGCLVSESRIKGYFYTMPYNLIENLA